MRRSTIIAAFAMLIAAPSAAQEAVNSIDVVKGALAAAASGNADELSNFVDSGSEAEAMGLKHVTLSVADFLPPTTCQRARYNLDEIRPKMVQVSWSCGSGSWPVKKVVLLGQSKIVVVIGGMPGVTP